MADADPTDAAVVSDVDLMTPAEHRAMDLTADLYNLLVQEVVGEGASRRRDIEELAAAIHVLQERILAQAAARAYPDRYRLLGGDAPRLSTARRIP